MELPKHWVCLVFQLASIRVIRGQNNEVIRWLKRYVTVERSTQEPSIYLIDPSEADRLSFGSSGKPSQDKVRNVLEGKHKDEPSQRRESGIDSERGRKLSERRESGRERKRKKRTEDLISRFE